MNENDDYTENNAGAGSDGEDGLFATFKGPPRPKYIKNEKPEIFNNDERDRNNKHDRNEGHGLGFLSEDFLEEDEDWFVGSDSYERNNETHRNTQRSPSTETHEATSESVEGAGEVDNEKGTMWEGENFEHLTTSNTESVTKRKPRPSSAASGTRGKKRQKKPAKGVEEENRAYMFSLMAVSFGWLILPFLLAAYSFYLATVAEKIARTGRRRNLSVVRKAKKLSIISLVMSFGLIILVFLSPAIITTVVSNNANKALQGASVSSSDTGNTNDNGGSSSGETEEVIIANVVETVGAFLTASENQEVYLTGEGFTATLVSRKADGGEELITFGRFLPPEYTSTFSGFTTEPAVLSDFCFAVESPTDGNVWIKSTKESYQARNSESSC